MFGFRPMFVPDGAASGQVVTGEVGTAAQGQSQEPVSPEGEETGEDFERDREEVRQMSSFLRDFQERHLQTQEPGEEPETPAAVETKPAKPEPGTIPAQPPGPESAPQVFTLPDGRNLTAEQVLELEKGAMMQADYTRKTQALAEERRLLEQQRQENERAFQILHNIERDPIGTLQKLQEEYEAKGFYEPLDPETLALEDKKRELDYKEQQILQKEQEMQQQAVYRDLDNRMAALGQQYGKEFDRQKVIQFMIDEKIYSPEVAYDAVRAKQLEITSQKQIDELKAQLKEAKKEAVNEYLKVRTTKKPASLPLGAGSTTGSPPVQVRHPRTLDDAKRSAMARPMPPA